MEVGTEKEAGEWFDEGRQNANQPTPERKDRKAAVGCNKTWWNVVAGWILLQMVRVEGRFTNTVTSGPTCDVPMPPQNLPMPVCPPFLEGAEKPTLEDAKQIAWEYAPVVNFHPLEKHFLIDPGQWYEKADMRLWDTLPDFNSSYKDVQGFDLGMQGLMLLPRSYVTILNSTKLIEAEMNEILAGAPFDENGQSQANIYYTVEDLGEDLWLYNFNLYYSWNGCSNQEFVINADEEVERLQYLMCPTGVHESDWCRVSVLVCKSNGQMMQTAYSQHSWFETRNCEAGQCPTEDGHPVAYSNLDGHGNYYEPSDLLVYALFNGTHGKSEFPIGLGNFGGIFVADRTASSDKKFVPSPENVRYIPPIDEIVENNLTDFEWAMFPGQWGAPLQTAPVTINCLNEALNEYVDCPENRAYEILETALKLGPLAGFLDQAEYDGAGPPVAKPFSNSSYVSFPKITGPLYRQYTYKWMSQRVAPIFSPNISLLTCPQDIKELDPVPGPFVWAHAGMLADYIIGISVGSFIFSILITFLLFLPVLLRHENPVQVLNIRDMSRFFKKNEKKMCDVQLEKPDSAYLGQEKVVEGLTSDKPTGDMQESVASFGSDVPIEVVSDTDEEKASWTNVLYVLLAGTMLIAGMVLVILGLHVMLTSSVLSAIADAAQKTSSIKVIEILITVGLALIVLLDTISVLILFFSSGEYVHVLGSIRMRNYLGGFTFVKNNQFRILIGSAGFTLLAINVAAVLFAVGWIVLVAQISLQTLCKTVDDARFTNVGFAELCFNIPYFSDEEICGWNVLQMCSDVTDMRVRKIIVGSAFLLWSQLVFLIMILFSLHKFYSYKLSVSGGIDHDLSYSPINSKDKLLQTASLAENVDNNADRSQSGSVG
eukprot:scaffold177_cov334-Pavlova_lutheri.AAC.49